MLAASAHSDAGGQCAATDPPFLLTCPIHPGRLAVVVEVVVMYYKAQEDRERAVAPFLLICPIHPCRLAVVVVVVVTYCIVREDREPLMGLRFGAAAAPTA
jgi:hypothetical protein